MITFAFEQVSEQRALGVRLERILRDQHVTRFSARRFDVPNIGTHGCVAEAGRLDLCVHVTHIARALRRGQTVSELPFHRISFNDDFSRYQT